MAHEDDLERLADVCASRLPVGCTFDALNREPAFHELLAAIRRSHPRFAFERDGRPEAIAAIRAALPVVERDLLDAVVDDHACEIAALSEALALLAQAAARAQRV